MLDLSTFAVSTGLFVLLACCKARAESVSFTLSLGAAAADVLLEALVAAWLALLSVLVLASGSCGNPLDEIVVFMILGILV